MSFQLVSELSLSSCTRWEREPLTCFGAKRKEQLTRLITLLFGATITVAAGYSNHYWLFPLGTLIAGVALSIPPRHPYSNKKVILFAVTLLSYVSGGVLGAFKLDQTFHSNTPSTQLIASLTAIQSVCFSLVFGKTVSFLGECLLRE